MNLANQPIRVVSKSQQLYSKRVKLTQKQMGDISNKVRKEVRERSGGRCEVKVKCNGARAVQQAHKRGRRRIERKTTAEDLWDSCLDCHIWLDTTAEGERYKRAERNH